MQIRDVLFETLQIIPLFVMGRYRVASKKKVWVTINYQQSDGTYGSVGEKPMLS